MVEKMDLSKFIIEETEEQKRPVELIFGTGLKDETMNIRLSSETKKSLEELAKKYNISVSEVVRQLAIQGMKIVKNSQK